MTPHLRRRIENAPVIAKLVANYAALSILKHIVPLPRLARWAWSRKRARRETGAEERVIAAVVRVRNWFGGRTDCLQGSLLLYRELSRVGAHPTLVVGFRRQHTRVEGHAWVTLDGRTVPGDRGEHLFEPAFCFGRDGLLQR